MVYIIVQTQYIDKDVHMCYYPSESSSANEKTVLADAHPQALHSVLTQLQSIKPLLPYLSQAHGKYIMTSSVTQDGKVHNCYSLVGLAFFFCLFNIERRVATTEPCIVHEGMERSYTMPYFATKIKMNTRTAFATNLVTLVPPAHPFTCVINCC